MENQATQDLKAYLDFKDNPDLRAHQVHPAHPAKLFQPLNLWPLVTECLDKLDHQDQWDLRVHPENEEPPANEDLKEDEECRDRPERLEQLAKLASPVIRVWLVSPESLDDR